VKLLVLTPIVPYPPHDGDKLRLYHFLSHLKRAGHHIDLFCLSRVKDDFKYFQEMGCICDRLYLEHLSSKDLFFNLIASPLLFQSFNVTGYFSPQLRDTLRAYWKTPEGQAVDVILAHRLRMAPAAYESNPGKPVVLDLTDCLTDYTRQLKGCKGAPPLIRFAAWWDHWFLKSEEAEWSRKADFATVISEAEEQKLCNLGVPREKVRVVPNGVPATDGKKWVRPEAYPTHAKVVCFSGNMGYAANEDAAIWFLDEVWPRVRREVPDAVFACVGGHPKRKLIQRHNGQDVLVTGWVPQIEPYAAHPDVAVAPLRVASGMQNKVVMSMALGVPLVATAQAVKWLSEDGRKKIHSVVEEVPDIAADFAGRVIEILRNPRKAKAKAHGGKNYIRRNYSWDKSGQTLEKILKEAKKKPTAVQPYDFSSNSVVKGL
jgi:glycosyltransferase involved in cell wall biosynthesis